MRTAFLLCVGALLAVSFGQTSAEEKPTPLPEGIKLLPGYTHEGKMGIHGPAGVIAKKGGLKIEYQYGKVPGPDDPITSADYTDRAQALAEGDRRWYKEQTVGGKAVHLAYGKDDVLHVSFPAAGVNFRVTVK